MIKVENTIGDAMRDLNWWQWAATWVLLLSHVLGLCRWCLPTAIVLCAASAVWMAVQARGLAAYPVQIRVGFLLLLLVGLMPGMGWMHYSQLLGMSALLSVGYCPMHRMLMLMPWNRAESLTLGLASRVLLAMPGVGGAMRVASDGSSGTGCIDAPCAAAG